MLRSTLFALFLAVAAFQVNAQPIPPSNLLPKRGWFKQTLSDLGGGLVPNGHRTVTGDILMITGLGAIGVGAGNLAAHKFKEHEEKNSAASEVPGAPAA